MFKPWPLALAITLGSLAPVGQVMAELQQHVRHFDLPAGSLATTLNAIATQGNQILALDPNLVRNLQAPAIRGEMTALQALHQALEGSGLEIYSSANGHLGIRPAGNGEQPLELGNIEVRDAAQHSRPNYSSTTLQREDLERLQPATLFEAVREIPGVEVSGGPRASGMSFNIRGFHDSQDILVRLDGVRKSFGKYRMGSGLFIEPDLLKSIEVQKGPQLTSGSGAIGGAVLVETKDATDLLHPGQQYGARAKLGYADNNDEFLQSYSAYMQPHQRVDALYSYSRRQANNFTLPKGSILESGAAPTTREGDLNYSESASESHLLKVNLYPSDSLKLTTSFVYYEDSSLQRVDTVTNWGGNSDNRQGGFGNTLRSVEDFTVSQTVRYFPADNPLVDLKATLGSGHTTVEDFYPTYLNNTLKNPDRLLSFGGSCQDYWYYTRTGVLGGPTGQPARNQGMAEQGALANCKGALLEEYTFEHTDFELSNNALLHESADLNIQLLAGYQYSRSRRETEAQWESPLQQAEPYAKFIYSAVPGLQYYQGVYLQPAIRWKALSVFPVLRYDRYTSQATGDTKEYLLSYDWPLQDKVHFGKRTTGLSLDYELLPNALNLFANYSESFRGPSLNNYFGDGSRGDSPCHGSYMPINYPMDTGMLMPEVCGDRYQPQVSETTELGLNYQDNDLLDSGVAMQARLTFFHISTRGMLRSLRENAAGQVLQDGWERRDGVELESEFEYARHYARLGYSRNKGRMTVIKRASDWAGNQTDSWMVEQDITTIPGNTLNLNLGTRFWEDVDLYVGYRKVGERLMIGNLKQAGYEIYSAGVHWKPTRHFAIRLLGENLTDKPYNYNGGGDFADQMGLPAPGRNLRVVTEFIY